MSTCQCNFAHNCHITIVMNTCIVYEMNGEMGKIGINLCMIPAVKKANYTCNKLLNTVMVFSMHFTKSFYRFDFFNLSHHLSVLYDSS